MTESEKVQYTIDTGMSTHICIPGKIDFEILHRHIPDYEGKKPHEPILWRDAKNVMIYPDWIKVCEEMQIAIDNWWVQKNNCVAEQKIVKKLVKIKKMVEKI